MPRVRDVLLGSGAAAVAAGGLVLLAMVRSEAARSAGEDPEIAPPGAPLAAPPAGKPGETPKPSLPPPRPRPTAPHAPSPARTPLTLPSFGNPNTRGLPQSPSVGMPVRPTLDEGEALGREQGIEQRKLASLERRARAIQRRMENSEKRGNIAPDKTARDRTQLDNLLREIRQKRGDLGLPPDWSPTDEIDRP